MRFDSSRGEVLVFTYKDGPLSTVAHDLKLKVERFTITETQGAYKAEFDAKSLKVVCAMRDGVESPDSLASSLFPDVMRNVERTVLDAAKHPSVAFTSTKVTDSEVVGQLTLRGISKEVKGTRSRQAGRHVAEFSIDQRDFGITPFSAMLGAIRLKPRILVRISLSS